MISGIPVAFDLHGGRKLYKKRPGHPGEGCFTSSESDKNIPLSGKIFSGIRLKIFNIECRAL